MGFSMISNNTQWQRWYFHPNFAEEETNFKEIKYLVRWTKPSKCRTILRYTKLLADDYILSTYHVPGIILGAGKMAMKSTDKKAALLELMFWWSGSTGRQWICQSDGAQWYKEKKGRGGGEGVVWRM